MSRQETPRNSLKRYRKKRRSESLNGSDTENLNSDKPKYNERFVGSPRNTSIRPLHTSLNNLPGMNVGMTSTDFSSSGSSQFSDSSDENSFSDELDFSRKISSPVSRNGSFSMRTNFYSQQASPILTRKRSLTASQV